MPSSRPVPSTTPPWRSTAARKRCDPPDELVTLALEIGCLFSVDSDAHAPGQLDMKAYGCERAERLGVPADRIVTTWDVDRVREWAAPS